MRSLARLVPVRGLGEVEPVSHRVGLQAMPEEQPVLQRERLLQADQEQLLCGNRQENILAHREGERVQVVQELQSSRSESL